jgi:hypothetical protein
MSTNLNKPSSQIPINHMNFLENQKKKILTWPLGIAVADSADIFFFPFLLVLLLYLADKKERLLAE